MEQESKKTKNHTAGIIIGIIGAIILIFIVRAILVNVTIDHASKEYDRAYDRAERDYERAQRDINRSLRDFDF